MTGGLMLLSAAAGSDTIKTALDGAFTSAAGTAFEYIGIAITAAVGIYAVKIAVGIGISFFSKIAKKG